MPRVRLLIVMAFALVLSAPAWADIVPAGTLDTTTLGNWLGVYGSEGYILAAFDGVGADRVSLPSYISGYYLTDELMWVWDANSPNPQGLLDPGGSGNRVEATWYRDAVWSVTITPTETKQFKLALYMLDPENMRTQTLTFTGAGLTGTDQIAPIHPGTWMVYDVTASAGQDITVTFDCVGGHNAVLSAMAFDPIPEPAGLALLTLGACLPLLRKRR